MSKSAKAVDKRIEDLALLAWVGEDEMGSGEVGIKQCLVPAGMIPIVAVESHRMKVTRDQVFNAMVKQANEYGKTIVLGRFVFERAEIVIEPSGIIVKPDDAP